jgi:hypothetical protein
MRRIVFLAAMSLMCALGVSAQQHNIDTQKSTFDAETQEPTNRAMPLRVMMHNVLSSATQNR